MLIERGDAQTRGVAIVAIMVRGLADEHLARAILDRWTDLTVADKIRFLRALDERNLHQLAGVRDQEIRVFANEQDVRVQLAILLTVNGEIPAATLMPLLVRYATAGFKGVTQAVYTIAANGGAAAIAELKKGLRERDATKALLLIEQLEERGRLDGDPDRE